VIHFKGVATSNLSYHTQGVLFNAGFPALVSASEGGAARVPAGVGQLSLVRELADPLSSNKVSFQVRTLFYLLQWLNEFTVSKRLFQYHFCLPLCFLTTAQFMAASMFDLATTTTPPGNMTMHTPSAAAPPADAGSSRPGSIVVTFKLFNAKPHVTPRLCLQACDGCVVCV
jgi:hypothetical protein